MKWLPAGRLLWLLMLCVAGLAMPGPVVSLWAQPAAPVFSILNQQDGLPTAQVSRLLFDRQGFLWIATRAGLARYDGRQVTPVALAPSPPMVLALLEDAAGALWIGTLEQGLFRLDPVTQQISVFRHDPDDPRSLAHDTVQTLFEDRDGTLWIGTNDGLQRFDPASARFVTYRHDPDDPATLRNNYVSALTQSRDGALWVGTRAGLHRSAPEAPGRFQHFGLTSAPLPLNDDRIATLAPGLEGGVWVGSFSGVTFLDPARGVSRHLFSQDGGISLRVLPEGRVLVGGLQALYLLDPITGRYQTLLGREEAGNSGVVFQDLKQDRNGTIWAAHFGQGVWSFDLPRGMLHLRHRAEGGGLPHDHVRALAEGPGGALWLGTSEGLVRLDAITGVPMPYARHNRRADNEGMLLVSAVLSDARERLWVSTFSGLHRYDGPVQVRRIPFGRAEQEVATVLFEDRRGDVWVGTTQQGLYRHRAGDGTVQAYGTAQGLRDAWIETLFESADGTLWVGTQEGLHALDPATDRFVHHPLVLAPGDTLQGLITGLAETPDGALWVGTQARGLLRYQPGAPTAPSTVQRYGIAEGLPHERVVAVAAGGGAVYVLTPQAVSALALPDGPVRTLAFHRRLGSAEFTTMRRTPDGRLYLGSFAGLFAFHPDSLGFAHRPPPVVLTDFQLFNTSAPLDTAITYKRRIELPHDQNFVGFTFAALDFAAPERNRYRYRLDGLDPDWVTAEGRTYAGYPNLQPGRYVFRVRAADSRGTWSKEEASVALVIHPPYWATWWFRTLLVLLLAAFLTALYRYRVHHLLQVERARNRIADDLHDDIGSKVSSIALMAELAARRPDLAPDAGAQMHAVAGTARRLVDDLRDTVWVIDTGMDRLDAVVARMERVARQMLPPGTCTFEAPNALPPASMTMEQRRHLLLLYKEALHNVVRHADAAHVAIDVTYADGHLGFRVADDGRGFDAGTPSDGRGRKTMRERAAALGGTLHVESRPGAGTTVTFRMRTE